MKLNISYQDRRKIVDIIRNRIKLTGIIDSHQYRCFRGQILSKNPNYIPLILFLERQYLHQRRLYHLNIEMTEKIQSCEFLDDNCSRLFLSGLEKFAPMILANYVFQKLNKL